MKRFLKLTLLGYELAWSQRLMYRADYVISIFSMILGDLIAPIFILIVYGVSAGFEGWTLGQMILLTGFIMTAEALAGTSVIGVLWGTYYLIKRGEFDLILLMPGNALANIIHMSKDVEDIGKLLAGCTTLGIGIAMTGITFWQALLLVLMLPIPYLFFASIAIISSALSIKYVNTLRMFEFIHMGSELSRFPGTIYPRVLRTAFLTLFPVAAAGFVPVGLILGVLPVFAFASFAAILLFFAFSLWFWGYMLRSYTSAGG